MFSRMEKSCVKHFPGHLHKKLVTCEELPKAKFHLFLRILKIVWIPKPSCMDTSAMLCGFSNLFMYIFEILIGIFIFGMIKIRFNPE